MSTAPEETTTPDTRARLLDAAIDVMAEKGFERATLREIAREAGLTTGAVYSTYSNKLDLLRDATARILELNAPTASEESRGIVDGIDRSAHDMWRLMASGADVRRLGILQFEALLVAMRNEELIEEQRDEAGAARKAAARDLAAKARAEGITLPLPAEQVVVLVDVLSQGLQLRQYLDPDAVDEDLYRNALRLVCGLPPVKRKRRGART